MLKQMLARIAGCVRVQGRLCMTITIPPSVSGVVNTTWASGCWRNTTERTMANTVVWPGVDSYWKKIGKAGGSLDYGYERPFTYVDS